MWIILINLLKLFYKIDIISLLVDNLYKNNHNFLTYSQFVDIVVYKVILFFNFNFYITILLFFPVSKIVVDIVNKSIYNIGKRFFTYLSTSLLITMLINFITYFLEKFL